VSHRLIVIGNKGRDANRTRISLDAHGRGAATEPVAIVTDDKYVTTLMLRLRQRSLTRIGPLAPLLKRFIFDWRRTLGSIFLKYSVLVRSCWAIPICLVSKQPITRISAISSAPTEKTESGDFGGVDVSDVVCTRRYRKAHRVRATQVRLPPIAKGVSSRPIGCKDYRIGYAKFENPVNWFTHHCRNACLDSYGGGIRI
jgi:hypothetical protein